jgi:hypothetical protein
MERKCGAKTARLPERRKAFQTRTDPAKYFFLRSDDRELFFPWVPCLFFGARWAVVVPTDAMRRSLERDVRVYSWATFGLGWSATAYLFARGVGADVLVLGALFVPLIIYSVVVRRRVRGLARIPARESVLLHAQRLGQEKLWGQVFLGFFGFAAFAFFAVAGIIQQRPLAYAFPGWWAAWLLVALFLANAVLALRALRMLPTDRGEIKET